MQPSTIDTAVNKVMSLGNMFDQDRVSTMVYVLTACAIQNVKHTPIYVEFMIKMMEKVSDNPVKQTELRKIFLNHCKRLFDSEVKGMQEFKSLEQRARCLGIMRLLGVTFLYELLSHNHSDDIAQSLLEYKNSCRMECFYEFVVIIRTNIKGKLIRPSNNLRQLLEGMHQHLITDSDVILRSEIKKRLMQLASRNLDRRCALLMSDFSRDSSDVLRDFAMGHYPELKSAARPDRSRSASGQTDYRYQHRYQAGKNTIHRGQ